MNQIGLIYKGVFAALPLSRRFGVNNSALPKTWEQSNLSGENVDIWSRP
jgi:hypothetical protein